MRSDQNKYCDIVVIGAAVGRVEALWQIVRDLPSKPRAVKGIVAPAGTSPSMRA